MTEQSYVVDVVPGEVDVLVGADHLDGFNIYIFVGSGCVDVDWRRTSEKDREEDTERQRETRERRRKRQR